MLNNRQGLRGKPKRRNKERPNVQKVHRKPRNGKTANSNGAQ